MNSVLISIQPKWCELIASGKKPLEVRKTRPKIDTPFKCYIYQTKMHWVYSLLQELGLYATARRLALGTGKVIGEFVCDKITMSLVGYNTDGLPSYWDILDGSCLTPNELVCYGEWKALYGWHISNLVIYDEPKELSEFYRHDNTYDNAFGYAFEDRTKSIPLKRPPQSWCYVENDFKE